MDNDQKVDELFNEYLKPKPLQEILEELALHCLSITGKKEEIELYLPQAVLSKFNNCFIPKERIKLFGTPNEPISEIVLKVYHTDCGIVKIFSLPKSS